MAYVATMPRVRHRGLGQEAKQIYATVGSTLASAAAIPTPASPFLAVAAGVTALLASIGVGEGCGQTCIEASDYANQAGNLMAQTLATYLALPAPRSATDQQAALNIFQQLWSGLETACGNPSLNTAGENCLSQRQQGACVYKTSPGGWQQQNGQWTYQYPGANGSGTACWNYFVAFHDPIANDPTVTSSAASAITNVLSGTTGSILPLVLALSAGLLIWWMVK